MKQMTNAVTDLDSVLCVSPSKDMREEDEKLIQALRRIKAAGVTLSPATDISGSS